MDTVVLIAIPKEAPLELQYRDDVFFTGVGKVNAALCTARIIEQYKPKRVINFGTAGGITVGTGLYQCTRFVQRDMDCKALGFEAGQTPYEFEIALGTTAGLTCSTGDNFVSDPALAIPADIVYPFLSRFDVIAKPERVDNVVTVSAIPPVIVLSVLLQTV